VDATPLVDEEFAPDTSKAFRAANAADVRQRLFTDVAELVDGPETDPVEVLTARDLLGDDRSPVDELFGNPSWFGE
jgi:hypothetical protein